MKKFVRKCQYGDFQTPIELARKIVDVLKSNHNINPDIVIEPTCGKGSFILAAYEGFKHPKILGFDINGEHVKQANLSVRDICGSDRIEIKKANFFSTDWKKIISDLLGHVLIIGNPPWVTSSELGILNGSNLPEKSNFQNHRGIDAITGSGNFDISEWMLLQHIHWLSSRNGTIALLCKYSIARKVVRQVGKFSKNRFSGYIYSIDAKKHFGVSVEACLFVLTTSNGGNSDCEVYEDLNAEYPSHVIGIRDGFIVSDIVLYERWRHLRGQDARYIWRSGVKHDCSKVMELEPVEGKLRNGLGENVPIENDYLYPLLKGSDVGNGRTRSFRKLVLITQKLIGEDTSMIECAAPKTWKYLQEHKRFFHSRKSTIYKNKPDFSLFGIGFYAFKDWKIAISGFYKKLKFNLVGPLGGKSVIFDDTVTFLSFDTEGEAKFVYCLLTSKPSLEFLESMVFWDDKRSVTTDILRRLSLKEVARELGLLEQYQHWADKQPAKDIGQLKLGVAEASLEYNNATRQLSTPVDKVEFI